MYKKITFSLLTLILFISVSAQNQSLYVDTVKWVVGPTAVVKIKAKGFNNVINFQGSIVFDKNSLQLVGNPVGNPSLTASNFSFNATQASNGIITYLYSDAVTNHTVADGTDIITLNFNVINNPVSTFNDNNICFSNSPTPIGIDTAADVAGLSDLATLNSPNLERHTCGYVSFARPPFLVYSGGNVTDTVTNRPVGCTYQWTVGGSNVAGTDISQFNNAPDNSSIQLCITYPNTTQVCSNTVLPVKLTSFTGKLINGKVVLNWATQNETNNKGFDIEKSFNNKEFSKVGFVKAGANTANEYSYTDENSSKATWYRLKQIDVNGNYGYSNIVKISNSISGSINMYPNPAKGNVQIETSNAKQLIIINSIGQITYQENIKNDISTINTTRFSKGVYAVKVVLNNGTVKTDKLVVE